MGCSSSRGADIPNTKCENRPQQLDDDNENILEALYDMAVDTCDSSTETGHTTVESYPIDSVKTQSHDMRNSTLVKGGSQTNVGAVTKLKPSSKPKPCPHKPADRSSMAKTNSNRSCGDSSAGGSSGGGVSALSRASVSVNGRPPSLMSMSNNIERTSSRESNTFQDTKEQQSVMSIPPGLPYLSATSSVLSPTIGGDHLDTSDSVTTESTSSQGSPILFIDRTDISKLTQSTEKYASQNPDEILENQSATDNALAPKGESTATASIGTTLCPDENPAAMTLQSSADVVHTAGRVDTCTDNMSDVIDESSPTTRDYVDSNTTSQATVVLQPTLDPPHSSLSSSLGLTDSYDEPPAGSGFNDRVVGSHIPTLDMDAPISSPVVDMMLKKETDETKDDVVVTQTGNVTLVEECTVTTTNATFDQDDSDRTFQSTTPVLDSAVKIEDDVVVPVLRVSSTGNCENSMGGTVPGLVIWPQSSSGTFEVNTTPLVEEFDRESDQLQVSDQIRESNDFSDLKERLDALKEIKIAKEVVPRREADVDSAVVEGRPLTARERLKLRVARSQSARLPASSTMDTNAKIVIMPALVRSQSLVSQGGDSPPPVPPRDTGGPNSDLGDGNKDISARGRLADRLAKSKLLRESLSPRESNMLERSFSNVQDGSPDSSKKASSDGSQTPITSKLKNVLSKSRQLRESFEVSSTPSTNDITVKDVHCDDCEISRTNSQYDFEYGSDSDSDSVSVSDSVSSNGSVSSDEVSGSGCAGQSSKDLNEDVSIEESNNSFHLKSENDPSSEILHGESATTTTHTSITGPGGVAYVDATSVSESTANNCKDSTTTLTLQAKTISSPTRRSLSLSKSKAKATVPTNAAYKERKKYKSPVPKQSSMLKSNNFMPSASAKQVDQSDIRSQRGGQLSQESDAVSMNTPPSTPPRKQSLPRKSSGDALTFTPSPARGLCVVSESVDDMTEKHNTSRFSSKIPSLTRESSDGSFGGSSCNSPAAVGSSSAPRVRSNSRRPSLIPQKSASNVA